MTKKNKEQSKRFIEKAKELGVDESGEKFNKVVTLIAKRRPHSLISDEDKTAGPSKDFQESPD